jgi:hypothetical protein
MKRYVVVAGLVLCICAVALAWPLTYSAPEIRARIVDEKTGEPVPDAVVLAQWALYSQFIGGGAGYLHRQHEFETTTDKNGWFVIPAWGPEVRVPYTELDNFIPQFRIFKAGYYARVLSNERRANPQASVVHSEWNGKMIALRSFDGDWNLYILSLADMWRGHTEQCRRSCPRLILAVYSEWERIPRPLPPEVQRITGPPPPFRNLDPSDRAFLEQFRDAQQHAK